MDYLDHVTITRHDSWSKFEQWRNEAGFRLVLFTTKGAGSYLDFRYQRDDILLFGRESAGVTDEVGVAELAGGARAVLLTAAPEVAAGKTAKHGRAAGMRAFALQGQEYLFDRVTH